MILTPEQQAEIGALCGQYGITQEMVAAKVRGRDGGRVDRSLVSKVWRGSASSRQVLYATYRVFVACGWKPAAPPSWLPPRKGSAAARAAAALAVIASWGFALSLLFG